MVLAHFISGVSIIFGCMTVVSQGNHSKHSQCFPPLRTFLPVSIMDLGEAADP